MNCSRHRATSSPPTPSMGAVTLLVGDLDGMTRYYRDVVTLAGALGGGRHRHPRPRRPADRRPAPRARAPARDARVGGPLPHRDPLRDAGRARRRAVLRRPPRARHLHRLGRPPRQPGVLLHRPRGQRHRAVLGPRAHRLVVDARPGRDGDALPRPERLPRRAPHRGGRARARPPGTRHPSVMCICRWGMSRPPAPSTSTPSASTRRRDSATRPCS